MGKIEKPEPLPFFDCGKCGVTFDNMDEYEAHCAEDRANHLTWGDSDCIYCGKNVHSPKNAPIFPFSKEGEKTPAVCDACISTFVVPTLKATGRLPTGETQT